jgi:hypothetical protein
MAFKKRPRPHITDVPADDDELLDRIRFADLVYAFSPIVGTTEIRRVLLNRGSSQACIGPKAREWDVYYENLDDLLLRLAAELWALQQLLIERGIVGDDEMRRMALRAMSLQDQAAAAHDATPDN